MGFVLGFLPWILYWILVGNVDLRLAICIALAVAVVALLIGRLRKQPWRSLEVGSLAVFVVLAIASFLVSDAALQMWLQPLSNLGLLLVALGGIVVGRPFVREYAAAAVDAETAKGDGFRYITAAMTWLWVVVFALMTVIAAIPPLVDGNASNQDTGSLLSVLCYWVLPYVLLGVAGLISALFPKWFDRQTALIDRREAAETPTPAPPAVIPADLAGGPVSIEAPTVSGHEDPLPIVVRGVPAGSRVAVELTGADLYGRSWRAAATFSGPADGCLRVGDVAPAEGDWTGADSAAPVWAMRFASTDRTPDLFVPPADPWPVTVTAEVVGVGRAQHTVQRRAAADGVRLEPVEIAGRPAVLAHPAGTAPPGGWPAVACFGGSEGGFASQLQTAALLASHGHLALAASWIDEEEAAHQIASIPLERFGTAVEYLRDHDAAGPVGALAISRGAEGLLAALSRLGGAPVALALISPSSVTWQAMGSEGSVPDLPSWTVDWKPVPWLPVPTGSLMPQLIRNAWRIGRDTRSHEPTLLRLRPAYEAGLRESGSTKSDTQIDSRSDAQINARNDAQIDAAAVDCPLLILTGADDEVWPAGRMAADLLERRGRTADHHQHYADAGHLIRLGNLPTDAQWTGGIPFGGTRPGQAAAQSDAVRRVLDFFGHELS